MRRSTRRLGVLTLTAAVMLLVLSAALAGVLAPGGSFYDDDTNIHQGNIEAIAAADITRGCNPPENTIYCPGSSVTRGQMAAFLARALELPAAATDHFVDDDGSIFESDINKVAEAQITRGCNPPTNDRYCPDSKVTRGQMAAFLVRALGLVDDGGGNLFTDDDGSIFEADIDRLGTAGVTKGCNPPTNDRYCPDSLVLRDQMASFLSRALGLDPMVPPTGFIGTFEGTDPDASHVTIDIGPTGSDHRVSVDLFDDGATGCLNSFGEFSPASFAGTGTRLDPTHIQLTAGVVCHTSGGDEVPPWSPLTGDFIYEPDHDVVTVDGVCHWRSDGGSVADCPSLSADLSWDNEVPPATGTTATGSAHFTLYQGQEEICFHITTSGLSGPVLADHIHVGEASTNGGVVVNLGGALDGCVSADADLIKTIRQNPGGYYVNLHTALNPGGEVRGQLSK